MSDFEDRLREIARELSRTVERNIDDVAETFGVDAERARHFAEAAGQWLNERVEGGEELFGRRPTEPAPPSEHGQHGRPGQPDTPARLSGERGAHPSRPGPHPLDLPTGPQGLALSALESGRWTVRPGSNMLASTGEGPGPVNAAELVSDLRARDWIKADGDLTLVGRRALGRWCDAVDPAVVSAADATAPQDTGTAPPPADPS